MASQSYRAGVTTTSLAEEGEILTEHIKLFDCGVLSIESVRSLVNLTWCM